MNTSGRTRQVFEEIMNLYPSELDAAAELKSFHPMAFSMLLDGFIMINNETRLKRGLELNSNKKLAIMAYSYFTLFKRLKLVCSVDPISDLLGKFLVQELGLAIMKEELMNAEFEAKFKGFLMKWEAVDAENAAFVGAGPSIH